MKKTLSLLVALAAVSISSNLPANADHHQRARQDQHEANHQEAKANRDAARGNMAGAERHEAEANHDENKAENQREREHR